MSEKAVAGFVGFLLANTAVVIYAIWASVDESALHRIQFTYYPDKYWAVACPAFFVMAFLYYWTTYIISYMKNTKPLTDMHCLTDSDAKGSKASLGTLTEVESSVPPISDIPVTITSRVLHLPW